MKGLLGFLIPFLWLFTCLFIETAAGVKVSDGFFYGGLIIVDIVTLSILTSGLWR